MPCVGIQVPMGPEQWHCRPSTALKHHFQHLQQLHQCTCMSTQTSPGPRSSLPKFPCPETKQCSTSLFSWKLQHHPGMLKPGSTTMEWGVHTSCHGLKREKLHPNRRLSCELQPLTEPFNKQGKVCRERNIYCQSTYYYFYLYLLSQDRYNLNMGRYWCLFNQRLIHGEEDLKD